MGTADAEVNAQLSERALRFLSFLFLLFHSGWEEFGRCVERTCLDLASLPQAISSQLISCIVPFLSQASIGNTFNPV